jgi:diguanylate cyclase (GGDEF)-like protein
MTAASAPQDPSRPPGAGVARAPEETPPLRVILIGRTGLDGKLRLDPGVELVRVKTPLEAVGELSNPIDPLRPSRAVVIVAPDADPGGEKHDNVARAGDFLAALRHVDPTVRVLRVETPNGSAPVRAGYDGVVAGNASPDVLRAALRGIRTAAIEITEAAPSPPPTPAPEPAPEPSHSDDDVEPLIDAMVVQAKAAAAVGEGGDETLVRLLIHGRDITDAAVDLLRRRLERDLVFVSAGRAPGPAAARPADGQEEAVVAWRGRVLGRLRSRELSSEQLATHAAWLAAWLALRDQHAQLREAAFTDALTGAHNRRFFDHFLQIAMEHAGRERRSLTVLMFDIDNFKLFNDTHGHAVGDEILKETVRLLQSVVRPSDKVCRIGGDEFVVIFHEPTGPRQPGSRHPNSIGDIAKRFQGAIAAHKFPKLGRELPGALAISGGLATYPWDGRTAEELLERADALALKSKQSGKNAITLGPGAELECQLESPEPETEAPAPDADEPG